MSKQHNYWVYMVTNKSHRVLYTGVTNDISRRALEHKITKNPTSFTAKYNAFKLVYCERYQYVYDALAREKQIKGWMRYRKDGLVNSVNPKWEDLFELEYSENDKIFETIQK